MFDLLWYTSGVLAFNSLSYISEKAGTLSVEASDSKAIQMIC